MDALSIRPGHVVIDGRPVRGLGWEHKAVVKADYRIHCVACASVVAKVCRDRLMERLHPRYPGYGWDHNRGYATDDDGTPTSDATDDPITDGADDGGHPSATDGDYGFQPTNPKARRRRVKTPPMLRRDELSAGIRL